MPPEMLIALGLLLLFVSVVVIGLLANRDYKPPDEPPWLELPDEFEKGWPGSTPTSRSCIWCDEPLVGPINVVMHDDAYPLCVHSFPCAREMIEVGWRPD